MADDTKNPLTGFWAGLRKKATETVASQEAVLARGKTAARPVYDDSGNCLVDAGHVIDDRVIARAREAGKLRALVAAALAGQAQDVKARAQEHYARTPEGQEAHSLASADDYQEARRYLRRIAGVDVTDIRGIVLVPAGKQIDDEDIRKAREAGQLAALIYAAQQPAPPELAATPAPPVDFPLPTSPPVRRRAPVPLANYPDPPEAEDPDKA